MSNNHIRFIRLKLFLMYSFAAWYSLYNPKPGLEMVLDHDKASADRAVEGAKDRILRNRRRKPDVVR